MSVAIACPKCGAAVFADRYNLDHLVACRSCTAGLQVLVFPAHYRSNATVAPEGLVEATDATCFFHAENRAVVSCASCGRFLCSVCQIDLGGDILCPTCVQQGIQTRKLIRLENRRVLYDSLALVVALVPMLLIWPSVITAPIAIYIAVRYWRSPSSLIRRTKIRYILAIAFAFAQLGFWGFVTYILAVSRGLAQ